MLGGDDIVETIAKIFNHTKEETILIIEDNVVNRTLLSKILESEYNVLEAENGKDGLDLLLARHEEITAVMLDIMMPVMDGFEFLQRVKNYEFLKDIPIVVSTGNDDEGTEIKALEYGAWDYIIKPYRPLIIKFRLRNAITRSQLMAFKQLQYLAEFDELTRIYNKNMFYDMTRDMFTKNPDTTFAMLKIDLDRFNLINSYFGFDEGDKVLKYVAHLITDLAEQYEYHTYCRLEGDIFGLCIPYKNKEQMKDLVEYFYNRINCYGIDFEIIPSIGINVVKNKEESIEIIMDHAILASKYAKDSGTTYYYFYNNEMSEKLERDQEITNEMNAALESHQFEVYLQPKCYLKTNKPLGAEALVRWNHPTKGMISPGVFIPVFERNGFIAKLDYYMWESVCQLLRKWLDEGKKPRPISVNVSRVNFLNPKLLDNILALCKKYDIPTNLLNLELTESAYIENIDTIQETIKQFQKHGFTIMMDDFGSGYSSLNVLKDVSVDVLKIDIKFFCNTKHFSRAANIVASVMNMTKWLNIPVIAEGVEKASQVKFLRSIGCDYVQGYYFAKPMPVSEYEPYIEGNMLFDVGQESELKDEIVFVNSDLDTMFTNSFQPCAIYEYKDGKILTARANQAYMEFFGYESMCLDHFDTLDYVESKSQKPIQKAFDDAIKNEGVVETEYVRLVSNNRTVWVHLFLRYLTAYKGSSLLVGMLVDMTAQKEMNTKLSQYQKLVEIKDDHLRILIVDDDQMNHEILSNMFNKYEVIHAYNGNEAITKIEEHNYDIDMIILDMEMPIMNGMEFLEYKQNNIYMNGIPTIVISADDSTAKQVETLKQGVNDYIVKPFTSEIVLQKVLNVMRSHQYFKTALQDYNERLIDSEYDYMTSLLSRSSFEATVEAELHSQSTNALIVFDVAEFKKINEEKGHLEGDKVLKTIALQLKDTFRDTDFVGRIGGDCFSVYAVGMRSRELVEDKCQEFLDKVNNQKDLKEHLQINYGIAMSNIETKSFVELFTQAEENLKK